MSSRALEIHGLLVPSLPARSAPAEARRRPAGRLAVERAVLEGCRRGDPEAFDALFEKTKDHVYTLALYFSGDEPTAADVTQEVFVKLLDRVGQFREDAELSTWLYRVVLNTFLDHRRGLKPWIPFREPAEPADPPPELIVEAPQEAAAARAETALAVRRAVAELKPRWRVLVVLRYGAGLSYEEIAEVLEISPGTVASRLNRAHARLAKKLRHLQRPLGGRGGELQA